MPQAVHKKPRLPNWPRGSENNKPDQTIVFIKNKWIFFILFSLGISSMAQNVRSPTIELRLGSSEIHDLSIQALKGDGQSAKELASCYRIGYNDYQKGSEWHLIGAENRDAGAQYSISIILRDSTSILDRERGCYWLYLAIENGHRYAVNYKKEINKNTYLLEKQKENSEMININNNNLQEMKIRAMRGNGIIALKIANFYEKKNNNEMSFWLRIGAQNGNHDCMRRYGYYLMNTKDKLNKIRGFFWLERSRSAD